MKFGDKYDEIQQYLDAQYIGTFEAICHLLQMHMHEEKSIVVCLNLCLLGLHQVGSNPIDNVYTILTCVQNQRTKLTALLKNVF